MVWKGTLIGAAGLLLCIPLGLSLLLAIGLGMLLACGNVFFRDVEQLTTAGFTLWFFLTPILYPASLIPESIGPLFMLNPMVAITDAYRSIILSGSFTPGLTRVRRVTRPITWRFVKLVSVRGRRLLPYDRLWDGLGGGLCVDHRNRRRGAGGHCFCGREKSYLWLYR